MHPGILHRVEPYSNRYLTGTVPLKGSVVVTSIPMRPGGRARRRGVERWWVVVTG